MNEKRDQVVHRPEESCIYLSPQSFPLPRTLLQGAHETGLLFDEHGSEPWQWEGFTIIDQSRYVSCRPMEIEPFLKRVFRDRTEGLRLLVALARSLSKIIDSLKEHQYRNGLNLDALFVTDSGRFLLLPPSLTDLLESSMDDGELFVAKGQWTSATYTHQRSVNCQLTSIAYALLTGEQRSPLADERVRLDGYKAIPIGLVATGLPEAAKAFFDQRLSRKSNLEEELSLWAEAASAALDLANGFSPAVDQEGLATYLQGLEKRARRRLSLRKNRTRNIIIVSVAAVLILVGGSILKNVLAPPATAGLDAQGVIEFYYQAHNDLDTIGLDDALDKGVKSDAESTLTYLYVTSAVRQAYEQTRGFIPADQWVAEGKPDVPEGTVVYGVDDLVIEKTGQESYRVTYTLYAPLFPEEGSQEPLADFVTATRITEELDMRQTKESWVITAIRRISSEAVSPR